MRHILAIIVCILGIAIALYVGGWLMLVQPILACCVAFDAGTLSAMLIGKTVLKCIFASCVGGIIVCLSVALASLISD